jgi:hypothetical protein
VQPALERRMCGASFPIFKRPVLAHANRPADRFQEHHTTPPYAPLMGRKGDLLELIDGAPFGVLTLTGSVCGLDPVRRTGCFS